MKIIVSATLGGGSAGTWYAIESAKRFHARGHQVWYLSRRGHSALERARAAGIPTIDHIDLEEKSPGKYYNNLRHLIDLLRQHSPDVVLANGGEDHAAWGLAKAMRAPKVALIRVRALDPKPPKRHPLSIWLHSRATDMIVTANSRHFAAYQDRLHIPAARLRIIAAGIEPTDYADLSDNAMRENGVELPKGKPLVVMVARFAPIKGHRVLVSAAGILKRRGISCHFALVGYPKDYTIDQFKRWFVEGNLVDDFTVIDRRIPRLSALLSRCDIGVIASLGSETVSRSLLEYLASGLPAVATDVGGISDVMSHGEFGRLVRPDNATALADAIADLLSDNNRRMRMANAGRNYVHSFCTWDQRVDQWEKVMYETVARTRGEAIPTLNSGEPPHNPNAVPCEPA
jgi:glycosyltransferase involved in cell wall biosynthesis